MKKDRTLKTRVLIVNAHVYAAIKYVILARLSLAEAEWLRHSNRSRARAATASKNLADALRAFGKTFTHINNNHLPPKNLSALYMTDDEYNLLCSELLKYKKDMEKSYREIAKAPTSREALTRSNLNYRTAAAYEQLVRTQAIDLTKYMKKLKDIKGMKKWIHT